jgi:hypothetical protein
MILRVLSYILWIQSSYQGDTGICHVPRLNRDRVNVICLTDEKVAQVPSQWGGTYSSKVVTIYYEDGTMAESVDPDLIEMVEGI